MAVAYFPFFLLVVLSVLMPICQPFAPFQHNVFSLSFSPVSSASDTSNRSFRLIGHVVNPSFASASSATSSTSSSVLFSLLQPHDGSSNVYSRLPPPLSPSEESRLLLGLSRYNEVRGVEKRLKMWGGEGVGEDGEVKGLAVVGEMNLEGLDELKDIR